MSNHPREVELATMVVADEMDLLCEQEHQGQSLKHRHSWSCLLPTPTRDHHPQGYCWHCRPLYPKQVYVLMHHQQPMPEAMHAMRSHYLKMMAATLAHGRSGLKWSLIYVTYGQSLMGHCQGQTAWHPSWTAQSGHPRTERPGL